MRLGDLAEQLGGVCHGDADLEITALGTLEDAGVGDVTFLAASTPSEELAGCAASAVILRQEDLEAWHGAAVVCENPHLGYAQAARALDNTPIPEPGIHPSAVVANSATVSATASIGVLPSRVG